MIQVFAVHMEGGDEHPHIASVKWLNPGTAKLGTASRWGMVDWLEEGDSHRAYVCDGRSIVEIGVVKGSPSYIRTHADRKWTNNLLSLPRF